MFMKKPHIIILMHYLELGGAEMALIGLLSALEPKKVDVDLFIYSHQGPLMKYIPEWVNLLPEKPAYSVIEKPMLQALKKGQFGVILGRLLAKWKHRRYVKMNPPHGDDASIFSFNGKYITQFLPNISPKIYDLCISFLQPHHIGLQRVKAKKRLAWIHTDYSKVSFNTDLETEVWGNYDYIVSISQAVTDSFLRSFPNTCDKIIEIENILSKSYVHSRSCEPTDMSSFTGNPKFLSVGRFTYAKNYDNLPDIARRLVYDHGLKNLKWYIVGYGDDTLIRTKIHEAGMEEHVILLGKKENPYPYIKSCDVYVQPSRYEGKSVTVREAQMLCKPVAITAYPTATGQIDDRVDGIIIPLDNQGAAQGLADFICDKELQHRLIRYLDNHDYGNEGEVINIYKLIDID